MYGNLPTAVLFLSSCVLYSCGFRDPRLNTGTSANEDVLLAEGGVKGWNIEQLTPQQIHLSYLGDPTEMWVTWVS